MEILFLALFALLNDGFNINVKIKIIYIVVLILCYIYVLITTFLNDCNLKLQFTIKTGEYWVYWRSLTMSLCINVTVFLIKQLYFMKRYPKRLNIINVYLDIQIKRYLNTMISKNTKTNIQIQIQMQIPLQI